jgi:hypothetical protein
MFKSTKTHSGLSSKGPSLNHFLKSFSASSELVILCNDKVISSSHKDLQTPSGINPHHPLTKLIQSFFLNYFLILFLFLYHHQAFHKLY